MSSYFLSVTFDYSHMWITELVFILFKTLYKGSTLSIQSITDVWTGANKFGGTEETGCRLNRMIKDDLL